MTFCPEPKILFAIESTEGSSQITLTDDRLKSFRKVPV